MALTTAQQVRLRIQDAWRWDEESRVGDGTGGRSMVLLSHRRDGTTVLLARWTA